MQQLHAEIRRLRRELEGAQEQNMDLQDELREMTQRYMIARQDKEGCKQAMESVRREQANMERIVRESVERAVRAKDRQI